MALNTRDTSTRRLTTYVWGAALMLGVAIGCILLFPIFDAPSRELEDQYDASYDLSGSIEKVHTASEKALDSYKYDQEAAARKLVGLPEEKKAEETK